MIDTEKIIREFYIPDSDLYNILTIHSHHVANYALDILDKHPELHLDRDFIIEASMLHDVGIFLCDAPGIYCFGTHKYIEHGYLGADILRERGLTAHALVCERHTGVGISLESVLKNGYPLPHRDFLPVSMEEKLICYADKFFSKSKLNKQYTAEEARRSVVKFGEDEGLKFDALHALFG